jgi:hypothetical protein
MTLSQFQLTQKESEPMKTNRACQGLVYQTHILYQGLHASHPFQHIGHPGYNTMQELTIAIQGYRAPDQPVVAEAPRPVAILPKPKPKNVRYTFYSSWNYAYYPFSLEEEAQGCA